MISRFQIRLLSVQCTGRGASVGGNESELNQEGKRVGEKSDELNKVVGVSMGVP